MTHSDPFVQRYSLFLNLHPHNDNVLLEYLGQVNGHHIQYSVFNSFTAISIAFKSVRHMWENHTHMGEQGMVEATRGNVGLIYSLGYPSPRSGEWRVSMLAPKSRTQVHETTLKDEDPIPAMLEYLPYVQHAPGHPNDMAYDAWDTASPGW